MISILLPVYNATPFLQECLDSTLAQSEQNWELLAVNDYSTDNSWQVLQQYASEDARIRIFQNTAKGIIPALRMAFAQSKGDHLTRMDADDRMAPEKLHLLKSELTKRGTGWLTTGWVQYFSTNTLGDGYLRYQNWLNSLCENNSHFREIYRECVIPSPCWMVHREDLVSSGAFESDTYPEDYDLAFRFYESGVKVSAVQKVLHYWRDHPDRSSRNDPNYANQQYLDLKVPYFLELDYNPQRPLVLWGAGKKAKIIARKLLDVNTLFSWVCNNPKKWGKEIYGVSLRSTTGIEFSQHPQIIVAVASPDDQIEIRFTLKQHNFEEGLDFFFFC